MLTSGLTSVVVVSLFVVTYFCPSVGESLVRVERELASPLNSPIGTSATFINLQSTVRSDTNSSKTDGNYSSDNVTSNYSPQLPATLTTRSLFGSRNSALTTLNSVDGQHSSLSQQAIVGVAVACSVFIVLVIVLVRLLCCCMCQEDSSVSYPVFPPADSESSCSATDIHTNNSTYGSQLDLITLDAPRVQYVPATNRIKHTDVITNTADLFQY